MNTSLQTFNFEGAAVAIINHQHEAWMTGDDIGKALEYTEPRKRINSLFERNREELEEYSVDLKLRSTDGKEYATRVYNEEGVMLIGFLSKQPKAVAFRKWAVKVLKAYRAPSLTPPKGPLTLAQFQAHQQALNVAQKDLLNAQVIISAADLLSLKAKTGKARKTNAHKSWTPEESASAQHLQAQGFGPTYIARQLNRTVYSIKNHLLSVAKKQQGGVL